MRLRVEIALFCIINTLWIQHILCDGILAKSEVIKWTCTCSIPRQENFNFVRKNCPSSCDCSLAAEGSKENRWTCICSNGGFPRLVGEHNSNSGFTACDCNAGTLAELKPSNKWDLSKAVIIMLLLCLVLMALVFVASALWFILRKEKHSMQWTSPSSDRLTSCSSAINLMSRGSSSLPVYKDNFDSSATRHIGCIPKTSFLFRSRRGAIQGLIIRFSYPELESATDRFSDANLIGVGGSSQVYRGKLRDGRTVAIKRMKTQAGPDAEHVFLSEIELISRLHHCHVVPLLGYCSANQGKHAERLLVFEYTPNGNLRECLDGDLGECLEWNTRVTIALGAARGLEYLHEAAAPRILHRDVKSTNILLDDKWKAKISDLGMAKHINNDGMTSCSSSPARMQGTFGYFAPEYAIVGRASLKSDVFSFGVVLLELITGRNPIYKSDNKAEESLVIWATPRLHDSKRLVLELPDPRLKGAFPEEEMHVMAYLAKECLLLDPDSRPNMTEVVQILSTIAPDKSKRKNLPLHAIQYPSAGGVETVNQETCTEESDGTSDTEEIKQQITFETPARCSSPTEPDSSICMTNDSYSTDIEKLVLLTSKTRSWRLLREDEAVDLTEPRLESFSLPNVDSRIVTVA